jgi:aryl-alcohol dehydrogenase-like predicted oxidoreductase
MNYRRLGKSGLQLSELSFGTWVTFAQQISNETAEELVTIAYDSGVNFSITPKLMPTVRPKSCWVIF